MNNPELLFLAIGGADPALVARSERARRSRWIPLAAAACLLLVVTLTGIKTMLPPVTPPDSQGEPPVTTPNPPEGTNPGGVRLSLPEQGSEIGTLRLLSYAPESQDETVDFLIYVNEEQFTMQEEDGLYKIRSTNPLPEGFPECGMDIFHLPGTSPDQARVEAEDALKEHYPELSREELAAALPGSLYLRASEGLDPESEELWREEQAELWFAGDGHGGTFVLTARYFLEAEEGLGARFRDMASSFRVVDLDEIVPDWMRQLRTAADRLSAALLSDDLSGVSDLLTEGTEADAYGENVWPDVSIVSVDCTVDDDQNPSRATVSVKHRLNRVEGDSFSYLTMELSRRDGTWRLNWSGIEK